MKSHNKSWFGALSVLAAMGLLLSASPSNAAYYSITYDGHGQTGNAPVQGNYAANYGSLNTDATAATNNSPAVSAGAASAGCTPLGCAGGFVMSTASMDYTFSLNSHGFGGSVAIYIQTGGNITALGDYVTGYAEVSMGGSGGFIASTSVSNGAITCGNSCVNSLQHLTVAADQTYSLHLFAASSASDNSFGNVTSTADPYIYIDPTFLDATKYTLVIEDGIGNSVTAAVPEPSTWAMMVLGFAGLGAAACRRRYRRVIVC